MEDVTNVFIYKENPPPCKRMSHAKRTNKRLSSKTTVARTSSKYENNSFNVIKTPPRSAPVPARYSSSRLDQLATRRPYSSWKKPIKREFHRRRTQPSSSSNSGTFSREEFVSKHDRLTTGKQEIEEALARLHDRIQDQRRVWRQELSPKINEILYGITLSTVQTEDSGQCDDDDVSQKNKRVFLNREEDDDWNDSYSATEDSDCENSLYHECSGEYSQTEICLQQKVEELTELLAAKDQTILKLAAKLRQKDDALEELRRRHEIENNVTCKISSPAAKSSRGTMARMSFDSTRSNQGSFNEFVVKLSEELDSKLSEIDQMKVDHDMQIDLINDSLVLTFDNFESELLAQEEQIAAMATNLSLSTTNSSLRTNQTENINPPQVEMLVTELTELKEEQDRLRQALHLGNNAFHEALTQNCNNIMKSIREEFDSLHANELRSYNEPLQYEREVTRCENEKSKAESQRMKNETYDVTANETKRSDANATSETPRMIVNPDPMTLLSPVPTFESWSDFCKRFREALAGNGKSSCPKKLVLDNKGKVRADMFFKELCFVREGSPLREHITYQDTSERDDIFIDAISEPGY